MARRREYLMLAKKWESGKGAPIDECYVSEKLDGMRAFWDGGMSRGEDIADVPYANRNRDSRNHVCTGLWSRLGKPIFAPDWWLDELPPFTLDGELYMGHGLFQETMSCCKQFIPDVRWTAVKYNVFDMPEEAFWTAGYINTPHFKLETVGDVPKKTWRYFEDYGAVYKFLRGLTNRVISPIEQNTRLDDLLGALDCVVASGGEGLMVRSPDLWYPLRRNVLRKVKPWDDAEGEVVGYTAGNGKLLGLIGNLILRWGSIFFELSGFTDAERAFGSVEGSEWATMHPGEQVPDRYGSRLFPRDSVVTFKYTGLTRDGLPREARFWRKRGVLR